MSTSSIRNKRFFYLLIAQTFSIASVTAASVVITFAVLAHGGDVTSVGLSLAMESGSLVVALLIGGVLADRHGRRRIAILANVIRAVSTGALTILLLVFHPDTITIGVCGAIFGFGSGLYIPTITGLINDLVEPSQLQSANGVRASLEAIGQSSGPALVGAGIAAFSPFAGALILFMMMVAGLFALVRIGELPKGSASGGSMLGDLRDGWNELVAQDWAWKMILGYTFLHLVTFGPLFVLGPLVMSAHGSGAASWGVLLGVEGVGSLAGAIFGMRIQTSFPLRNAVIASLFASVVFFTLAYSLPFVYIAGGMFLSGAAFGFFGVVWETHLQLSFPSASLSRISAYDYMGSLALYPVGQILAGVIAPIVGISVTLVISGVFMIALSIPLLKTKSIWSARKPAYELEVDHHPLAA